MKQPHFTHEELLSKLHYDPETGIFTWRDKFVGMKDLKGKVAGSLLKHTGYWELCIYGKRYLGHRIAWFYIHGVMPSKHIDHINGNRSDNRIANLRDVSVSENLLNRRSSQTNNKAKLLGVAPRSDGKAFTAQINYLGKKHHLGSFPTAEEAHEAYKAARVKFGIPL